MTNPESIAAPAPRAQDPAREARARRHITEAEQMAAHLPELATAVPRDVRSLAVIGAGTMGSGIAIAALDAGCTVVLLEQAPDALQRGMARIHDHYAGRVAAGKLVADMAASCTARLHGTTDWAAIAAVDLVIEAVVEDLQVKRALFARLDTAAPHALLASNTSYLDVDQIAAATSRPQDVIGLHFFSPAHVMRLVEVVQGREASAEALATGLALARRLRKLPVVTRNAFGFVGNRIFAAYRRQCEFLVEEGAWPEQVDRALEAFGFAMGPFAVADLSGLDIAWRMRQSLAATRDGTQRYVRIPDLLCEAGRLGRKAGVGYYRYEGVGSRLRGAPDPAVHTLIRDARRAAGVQPRDVPDDEIQRRALLAMVNEACRLLAEGVARQPTDIDVALVNGYGFPRGEGGAVFWALDRGADTLRRDLQWLADVSGPGWVAGDPHMLQAEA